VVKRRSHDNEAQPDELGSDPGQVGSDSAGQSGDTQGLSQSQMPRNESVEELVDTDQAYEAEAVRRCPRMRMTTLRACTHQ